MDTRFRPALQSIEERNAPTALAVSASLNIPIMNVGVVLPPTLPPTPTPTPPVPTPTPPPPPGSM